MPVAQADDAGWRSWRAEEDGYWPDHFAMFGDHLFKFDREGLTRDGPFADKRCLLQDWPEAVSTLPMPIPMMVPCGRGLLYQIDFEDSSNRNTAAENFRVDGSCGDFFAE